MEENRSNINDDLLANKAESEEGQGEVMNSGNEDLHPDREALHADNKDLHQENLALQNNTAMQSNTVMQNASALYEGGQADQALRVPEEAKAGETASVVNKSLENEASQTGDKPSTDGTTEVQQVAAHEEKQIKSKLTKGQKYKKLKRMMKTTKTMAICSSRVEMYKYLARQFDKLNDYKNSQELAEKCRKKAKKTKKLIKQQIYDTALSLKANAGRPEDYKLAAAEFRKLSGYLDADELAADCDLLAARLERRLTIRRVALLAALVLLIAAALIFTNSSYGQYRLANLLMYNGSYDSAIEKYKKIGAYLDSDERISEAYYKKGLRLMDKADYTEALKAFEAAGGYKDSRKLKLDIEKLIIKSSSIKDTFRLCKYDCLILDITDDKALLMKKTSIPGLAYNDSLEDVTWESSSLRKWLNESFFADSFSAEEQSNIILSSVTNPANPQTGIAGGKECSDHIFILSMEEAIKYQDIIPKADYSIWLRTPGSSQSRAAYISSDKSIMENGYEVNSTSFAVRPVLWFNLK